jgi:hypothetical protein
MTTVMFTGMSFCLPLAFILERRGRKKAAAAAEAAEPLLAQGVSSLSQRPRFSPLNSFRITEEPTSLAGGSEWHQTSQ